MFTKTFTASVFAFVAFFSSVSAFSSQLSGRSESTSLQASRRAFIDATAVAFFSAGGLQSAFADDGVDDLAMPSADEIKQAEEDAMKEKLRRKAELQKQSTKPMSFKESMEMEKKKQKELSKSKEDRRNALCEELGRGC